MSLYARLRLCLVALTCACLLLDGGSALAKRKKRDGVTQDPMEAENSPPPPKSSGSSGSSNSGSSGSSGGSSGGGSSSGSGGSSQGSSGGGSSGSSSSGGGGGDSFVNAPNDKSGRFMFNFKIGPAFGVYSAGHAGTIVLDFGWSVLPNKNAYLLIPLQFQFAQGFGSVIIPVGFQYDFQMPVKNLFIYPRLSIGYAAFFGGGATVHTGTFIPEFGAKYVFRGRWNFGAELFSLPIFFGRVSSFGQNSVSTSVFYRMLFYAGVNF